jgi:hypothetical protein
MTDTKRLLICGIKESEVNITNGVKTMMIEKKRQGYPTQFRHNAALTASQCHL